MNDKLFAGFAGNFITFIYKTNPKSFCVTLGVLLSVLLAGFNREQECRVNLFLRLGNVFAHFGVGLDVAELVVVHYTHVA